MKQLMRLFAQALRISFAFSVGIVVRHARKALGMRPRIWHGFLPLHSIHDRVQLDRKMGYPARSVVFHSAASQKYTLVSDRDFDVVLASKGVAHDTRHWAVLFDLLLRADIWSTNFDCLFVPWTEPHKNERAFRLLRVAGIRIIVSVHGSDIPQFSECPGRYDWVRRLALDYPAWDFDVQTQISRERVRVFCRYADLVLPGDPTIVPWLPRWDVLFKYFPVSTRDLQPAYDSSSDVPVIVHAPNHRHVKGTQYLLEAVAALQAEGTACELRLIENVPHNEAVTMYREADIIADQFIIGAFGSFALEGCALGKPVLTYLEDAHLHNPTYYLPIVNTRPETIKATLSILLKDRELRRKIGIAAREAVDRFYSYEAIGEVWDRLYRHVWNGEPLALETTRHFSAERKEFPPITLVE